MRSFLINSGRKLVFIRVRPLEQHCMGCLPTWCWYLILKFLCQQVYSDSISYMFFIIFQWQKIFKALHQKSRYNWDISDQMKKEVCFNINQHIWTTLHRLVHGTSYLSNVGLTDTHSVSFSSGRNETEVLSFPFWLNILGKTPIQIENRSYLK